MTLSHIQPRYLSTPTFRGSCFPFVANVFRDWPQGAGRGCLCGRACVGCVDYLPVTAVSNSGVTSQPSGVSSMNIPTTDGPDSLAHDGRSQGSMVVTHLCVRAHVPGACVKVQSSEPVCGKVHQSRTQQPVHQRFRPHSRTLGYLGIGQRFEMSPCLCSLALFQIHVCFPVACSLLGPAPGKRAV